MRNKNLFFKLMLVCWAVLSPVLASKTTVSAQSAANQKPFVIPELRFWNGTTGQFSLTSKSKIWVTDAALEVVGRQLAADYETMFKGKLKVRVTGTQAKPGAGDIVISLQADSELGKEGYAIQVTDHVKLTAPQVIGTYWGTRTLLQIWEQHQGKFIPKGDIRDYPDYELRGFMLDCGRKFIPMSYLKDYVKTMSYYKMNTLQVHLNDNGFKQFFQNDWSKTYSAFRMESDSFPELTARDGHYGKQEFREFQIEAAKLGVEIIPEFDVPAHSLAFAHYNPELGSKEYGMDHLDLFNPKVYEFLDVLFKEYLDGENPVFCGKRMHIGTDEYSNAKKEVVEKFRYLTDRYIKYVESFGKQACVWGALTHAKGDTPVKSDNVVMNLWYNGYANPKDMLQQGYELISVNDGHTYIVPGAGYYSDYLNTEWLYNNWTPARIGGEVFDEKHPGILGGMYAVWNDHSGNGISVKDIHHRAYPALQTFSDKMWCGKNVNLPYVKFNELRNNLSEAPGVNQMGRVGTPRSTVYSAADVKPGKTLPINEIGYNYSVSFDINYANEAKGTELFSNDNAIFYLSDPISGMLGFSRDGYLYTFKYSVRPGVKETIRIEGDNKSTRLFVNNKMIEDLNIIRQYYDAKNSMYIHRTLVFPLHKAGSFKSKVSNLSVLNYCLSK